MAWEGQDEGRGPGNAHHISNFCLSIRREEDVGALQVLLRSKINVTTFCSILSRKRLTYAISHHIHDKPYCWHRTGTLLNKADCGCGMCGCGALILTWLMKHHNKHTGPFCDATPRNGSLLQDTLCSSSFNAALPMHLGLQIEVQRSPIESRKGTRHRNKFTVG
jgi:hypothetical protein